jgi:hypothetical protein
MWAFVTGNLMRALPGFTESRLLTEGVIFVNAILATVVLLLIPSGRGESASAVGDSPTSDSWTRLATVTAIVVAIAAAAVPAAEWWSVRHRFGDAHTGQRGMDFRLGPHANWHRAPLLKNQRHR